MLLLIHQQNDPVLRPSNSVYRPARSGASPSERASPSGDRDHRAQPQKTEAERDDSLTKVQLPLSKNYSPSYSVTGHVEGQIESTVAKKDGGLIESTGDSTTVWSSVELDMNYGQSAKCCAVLHIRQSHSANKKNNQCAANTEEKTLGLFSEDTSTKHSLLCFMKSFLLCNVALIFAEP